jgi:predicted DCC family thiol-disulfide oxidoreductase YuxK
MLFIRRKNSLSLFSLIITIVAMSVAIVTKNGFRGRILVNGFALSRQSSTRFPKQSTNYGYSSSSLLLSSSSDTISSAAATGKSDTSASTRLFSEEINVLYDSKCGVCKLEMDWLVSRDIRLNGPDNRKLRLTDLEDSFDETDTANGGIDYDTGMAAIYAIKHDGTVYKGVPVFEMAYDQVGLGWIWKLNNVPAINRFLNWGYEVFATNRTRITRGASLEELMRLNAEKKKAQEMDDCESCKNKIP